MKRFSLDFMVKIGNQIHDPQRSKNRFFFLVSKDCLIGKEEEEKAMLFVSLESADPLPPPPPNRRTQP